jgi:serine/threonine-protein kinase
MDLKRLELTGAAVPIVEAVATSPGTTFAQVAVSQSGTLVYRKSALQAKSLMWMDGAGRIRPLRAEPTVFWGHGFRVSPDGRRLAMGFLSAGNVDVWMYTWEKDTLTRLTFDPGIDSFPVWSPDGRHIVFSSDRHGGKAGNLYWMRADGTGEKPVRLTESGNSQWATSFSPDGKRLAFTEENPQTKGDIWTVPMDDAGSDNPKAGKPEPFLQTPFHELAPAISPDGRWLAYQSDESGSGSLQIYVRRFPGPGGKWQVSNEAVEGPAVWSRKSPELFFATAEGMMVVGYRVNGETFDAAKPKVWAANKELWGLYDLAPDGKRFAIAMEAGTAEQGGQKSDTRITFLLNFFDELRRRAPSGGK